MLLAVDDFMILKIKTKHVMTCASDQSFRLSLLLFFLVQYATKALCTLRTRLPGH